MSIQILSPSEYKNYFPEPYHIFNSIDFNLLNQDKCDGLEFLSFKKNGKTKVGIILGKAESAVKSPFSAPFGGFSFTTNKISLENIENATDLLIEYCRNRKYKSLIVTLPPGIYNPSTISKISNVFFRWKFQLDAIDLNYYIDLLKYKDKEEYIDSLPRNATKNLKKALLSDAVFTKCENQHEISQAYNIIKANRETKGYPLRMGLEQVLETIKLVEAEFFIIEYNNIGIAAAQVFNVSKDIVQVVYWGDLPGYEFIRPINLLAYHLINYYKAINKKIIDIGPSTEDSLPNYGLCSFKESIGSEVDLKYRFIIEF